MELRHLRYFITVAETLNFTSAARKLGIAQPPLSVQIRKLETELGTDLFDRSNRKVQLTPAGKIFFVEARNLLDQADRVFLGLQDAVAGRSGEIAIRYTPCALSEKITRRIRKFVRKNRGVRMLMESIDYEDINSLGLPSYDACIHDVLPVEKTDGMILEKAPIVLAVDPKHRLASNSEITPSDLLGERVLLADASHRSAAERHLSGLIEKLEIVVAPAPASPLERLWQASLGLGVTACSATDLFTMDTVLIPLVADDSEVWTMITPNPRSRAAGLPIFMDFLRA